jgi:hypothetical protein
MARITHPQPLPGTQTFIGVTFHDGFAEVDLADLSPHTVDSLIQHGFVIDGPADETPAEAPVKAPTAAEKRAAKKDAEAAALQERFEDGDEFLAHLRATTIMVGSRVCLTEEAAAEFPGLDHPFGTVLTLNDETDIATIDWDGQPADSTSEALVDWLQLAPAPGPLNEPAAAQD